MCALAVYLTTIVSLTLNISIDIAIGAPGHDKYVVEGLNMRDKIYFVVSNFTCNTRCLC